MQPVTLTAPTNLSDAKPFRGVNRNMLIVASVLLFHAAALWALNAGLLRRVIEVVVPVQILGVIAPQLPQPEPKPVAPVPQRAPEPVSRPRPKPAEPPAAPAPAPQAIAQAAPAPNAPTGVAAPVPAAAPLAIPDTPRPALEPAKVELPSSNASYLQNPTPVYPAISKRLGEQGRVLVRVLIGADGSPRQAELKRGSGYERLDRAALDYVMKCRYVPGKVAGVPQAMWYEAPVNFVLE